MTDVIKMTEQQPLVSIVIPCYNHAQFVQESIQSVIDQDYENIELIIIDDGSNDNSVEVIQEMIPACEERFVRFEFRHRPNKGLCATLNEALEWCEGEFFAPVASDDILMPYKTRVQVTYLLDNPESIGVFGGVERLINGEGKPKKGRKRKYNFSDIIQHKFTLPAPTQLLRLESVRNIKGYREDLIIEDWSMWLFLTENGGTLDTVSEVFAKYRRHDDNLSSKYDLMSKGRQQVLDLYSDSSLYRSAKAHVLLVNANSLGRGEIKSKILLFIEAIKCYPMCFFSKKTILFFIRITL